MVSNILDTAQLKQAKTACEHQREFVFADLAVVVKSNDVALLEMLETYYKSYHNETVQSLTHKTLYVIEQAVVGDELAWLEVPREAGKQGRKEGYLDAPEGGRWIKKFKTGLSLLQDQQAPLVLGPCSKNIAQVINFINNQFLNHYLGQDFMLGHAAAFSRGGTVTAIAAGSGGGKSTTMLHCLEHPERDFLTNDRLLFKRDGDAVTAVGLAKLPRVNPGTLLHSERLLHILTPERQQALRALSTAELWRLEEKYDVQIEDEYGPDRVQLKGQLANLVMLDWSLDSAAPTQLVPVDLASEADKIDGLRKRPGPFYQDAEGAFCQDLSDIDSLANYAHTLAPVKVYRLTGRIDFERAYQLLEAF
ncbi:HprK-related kinase B [Marinomonas ostreistagni]|nr:HprK-related kinase B [Marinomonas ostreistagni]